MSVDKSEWDFECVWRRMSNMEFSSLKEAHRHSYLAGRDAQKLIELQQNLLNLSGSLDSCGAETQKEIV